MKPRKQRLHSAELRRLDHIGASLDRIATALEKLPSVVVSGNDDTVIEDMNVKAGTRAQISLHGIYNAAAHGIAARDIENISQIGDINGENNKVTQGDDAAILDNSTLQTSENGGHNYNVNRSQGVLLDSSNSRIDSSGNNQQGDGNSFAARSIVGAKFNSSNLQIDGEENVMQKQGDNGFQQNAGHDTDGHTNIAKSGDKGVSATGEAKASAIADVSNGFNKNANDVIKDLTGALHRATLPPHKKED